MIVLLGVLVALLGAVMMMGSGKVWGQVFSFFRIVINTVFVFLAALLSNLRSVIISCMASKPAAIELQPIYLVSASKSNFIVFNAFIFKLKAGRKTCF